MASTLRRLGGHLRTVGHLAGNLLSPPMAPPAERWQAKLQDPVTGLVTVTGWLSRGGNRAPLVILVHGLGGTADSHYIRHAAGAAHSLGLDTLRLNLRGADPAAGDFYHAGLTAELHAAVADPGLAAYREIFVLGYSLGGHLALRYASEIEDPRVAAIAAVCSPLHLRPVAESFEQAGRRLYCRYVLRHLRRCFHDLERSGTRLPAPYRVIREARTFREWDALTVVPRFGFADADDYYDQASAAGVLDRLRVPSLLIVSESDPLIPPRSILPYLPPGASVHRLGRGCPELPPAGSSAGALTVVWHPAAGHVAFPRGFDLGLEAPRGLEGQLLGWAREAAPVSAPRAADRRN